jgi:hypothetical protein
MKQIRLITACGVAALVLPGAFAISASAGKATHKAHKPGHKVSGTPVSVRVEGMSSTLLSETTVHTKATSIDPDGKPADVCEGNTAAVALQDATHGHWTAGTFSSGLGYPVVGILGESYPFTSSYYWSFWVNDKPATTGICSATVHPGEHVLFFPQCSQENSSLCPLGMFDPPVLELTGPSSARVGTTITVRVSSLSNLTGKPSAGAGVTVRVGNTMVQANAAGKARLRLTKAGMAHLQASVAGAIRDELTVSVHR